MNKSSQPSATKLSPSPALERASKEMNDPATSSVFICWSGDRSHKIAQAIKHLLKQIHIPDVFVSDQIEKGAAWFTSIQEKLQGAQVGIVCLTSENLLSPWMHFEAGALARGLSPDPVNIERSADGAGRETGMANSTSSGSSDGRTQTPQAQSRDRRRLFTVLHGVTAAEIQGPLSAYQATSTTRREMGQLIDEINHILGNTQDSRGQKQTSEQPNSKGKPHHNGQACVMSISDETWKKFENELEQATVPVSELIPDLAQTFQRKTFNEPVHRCADRAWLARYEGARQTREKLLQQRDRVRAACPPHERELFELMLSELDRYAVALQALLLKPVEFDLGDSGELKMDEGTRTCCEDRRLAIKSMASRLLHPSDDPLTVDAVRFMAADTNQERRMIVHSLEAGIRQAWEQAHEDGAKKPEKKSAIRIIAVAKLVAACLARSNKQSNSQEESNPQCMLSNSELLNQQFISSTQKPLRVVRLRESSWDLDRIYYYLLVHYFDTAALPWAAYQPLPAVATDGDQSATTENYDLVCAARDVEIEVERYRARAKGGSLMPLTYGLMALKKLCSSRGKRNAEEDAAIKSAFSILREELVPDLKSEPGRQIERLLAEIE